jgi:hypothetical protein
MLDLSRECRFEVTVSFTRPNALSQSVAKGGIARTSHANLLKGGKMLL